MLDKKMYTNGQIVHQLVGNQLIYFFENGKIKAEGLYKNELMESEWKFYRETGQLLDISLCRLPCFQTRARKNFSILNKIQISCC
jgi:hypothetical protein